MNTFTPVDGSHFRKDEKKYASTSLMFLTKKRDGKIKGRACSDVRDQRGNFEKEDAAYLTVATESFFITSAIDAHERHYMETIDIPVTLLHLGSDKHIIMVLKEKLTQIMCHVDPKLYRK